MRKYKPLPRVRIKVLHPSMMERILAILSNPLRKQDQDRFEILKPIHVGREVERGKKEQKER